MARYDPNVVPDLIEALKPFADFLSWIEAAVEIGEVDVEIGDVDAITDSSVVLQLSAGGYSDALRVGDFRRAALALARVNSMAEAPLTSCPPAGKTF